MATHPTLATPRLLLRPLREQDFAAFAAMNADPRVMEWLPKALTRSESDATAARICDHFARHGFGKSAVEVIGACNFVGYVGLSVASFEAPFTPCVEIGWRLAFEHWGLGYATEGAQAVLAYAFGELNLDQVVSFTVPENVRSRNVMERLGMTRSPAEDFDHPILPEGHRLRRHVLYRMRRTDWDARVRADGRRTSRD
jgi:ribosomal-protein-alanine N-acetyltransferase